jgi:protein SCO1/2
MRAKRAVVAAALALLAACTRAPEPETREYELQGQVVAVRPESQELIIKHGDIKGFMPGMTMPFTVKDAGQLEGKQPGDLVTATLVVGDTDAYLSAVTKTGTAPLDPQVEVTANDAPVLEPGDLVPDQPLIDQTGAERRLSSFQGHRVALTFMYIRCPLPDFCPLMDKHFAAVQQAVKADPALADVRLISVSFDPKFDTPAALAAHAKSLGADPAVWTFMTGSDAEIERLTRRFGVLVERNESDPIDITHNLRTAVIDPQGRLVAVHSGTDWTPAQLVADLKAAPAPAR